MTSTSAMARYLLDTNVVIAAALGLPGVLDRLSALEIGDVAISAISLAEALAGAENDGRTAENISLLAETLDVLPLDQAAAEAYGALLRRVEPKRRRMLDRMIAAQALGLGLTLVAANTEDFDDIPGLTVEKWA
ncbi:MAG: type II toxin-antitoxin system VapC family toxin [Methylocystis sp.]